jgi:hypothetical protein
LTLCRRHAALRRSSASSTACSLTDRAKVATPVNWQLGERGIIPPSISDEQEKTLFTQGREAKKPYLRNVEVK